MNEVEITTGTIEISLSDGEKNAVDVFAASATGAPVLIIFPAMGVKGSYYKTFAKKLAEQNVHVVTADHRGHGKSSVRSSRKKNFGYREQVEIEYPAIVDVAKATFPGSKIFIMGHSLGGQMGGMFTSTREDVSGLILNASCSVYYKGWKGISGPGVLLASKFCMLVSEVMGYFPGNRLGFGGRESKGVIEDWAHTAATGNFQAKGSAIDYDETMKRSPIPLLALSYEGDTAAPYESVKNLVERFTSSNKTHLHLEPGIQEKKYSHYSWIKDPALSIPIIKEWMENVLNS